MALIPLPEQLTTREHILQAIAAHGRAVITEDVYERLFPATPGDRLEQRQHKWDIPQRAQPTEALRAFCDEHSLTWVQDMAARPNIIFYPGKPTR